MDHQYALSFEPEGGGHVVPADAYASALQATLDALVSARNAAAPIIAAGRAWPVAQVREGLELGIAPTEPGSLVVPIVLGSASSATHLDRHLGATYWRLTGRMLKQAATGRSGTTDLTAAGAESFAKAARFAGDVRCKLRLVQRSSPERRWTTTADLSALERPLRAYAERRQATRLSRAQVVGQLATLSFDPPTLTLVTSAGRRPIRLPVDLRKAARDLWGFEVIVDVEAHVTIEGDSRDLKALAIRRVPQIDEASFEQTLGEGKAVWGGEDAREYLDDLRGRGERH